MKEKDRYKQLVERYLEGTASMEEVEVFFHLLNKGKLNKYLGEGAATGQVPDTADYLPEEGAKVLGLSPWIKYGAAAAVLLFLVMGGWLWRRSARPDGEGKPVISIFKNEIAPGGNKAILTLGDGRTIVLDSAGKGNLTSQGGVRVTKVNKGVLAYEGKAATPAVYYNTLTTPAGGQFQIQLPDGTKVWLNALSSLRYPTSFRGGERVVELKGEGYFEVAASANIPFRVQVGGMKVDVLGTHFNINAYGDEGSARTTLLEGSVKLKTGGSELLLKPGQQGLAKMDVSAQAQTDGASQRKTDGAGRTDGSEKRGELSLVMSVDVGQAVAWKNGYFSFEGADIYTIMRQIARWYGVRIIYEGSPTHALFDGEIGRDLNLTQVLTGLDKAKVHFRLEGTTLTVLP